MLFQRPKIAHIAVHKGMLPTFPAEHLLFFVEGGLGQFRVAWYDGGARGVSPYDGNYSSALLLGETPLIQIQSSGCPTCESLLAAGYGLPEENPAVKAMRELLNRPYAGLDDALERLHPLLALLQSGAYILTYSQYSPTDGAGHFFWNMPEKLTAYQATAQYYDSEKHRVLPSFPCFLYPTQGTHKYDSQRVEYYRALIREGCSLPPVLTYSLGDYMSILLDGHHRASACALEGIQVTGLTISRPGRCWRDGTPYILWPDENEIAIGEIMMPRQRKYLDRVTGERRCERYPFTRDTVTFRRLWEVEYTQAAHRYPTCYDAGALALYPDVELSAEGIRTLAMDDDYGEISVAAQLLRYAARQPGANGKELALAFIAPGYPAELRQAAFEVLDTIKGDSEIDDLMIDVLVNCEKKDDPVYQIANGHWDI